MADSLNKEARSKNMASIKGKNTKPEIAVRKFLHREGFRFRIHSSELPGKPDLVMKKWNTVIFVNGCFWHKHAGCKLAYSPKSNIEFWNKKLTGNIIRDKQNYEKLHSIGWNVLIIWECEVKRNEYQAKLIRELKG